MKVVMPYVRFNPDVASALRTACAHFQSAYVGRSDDAYFWLLRELWESGRDFCVVEHDVVVLPSSYRTLVACGRPWCSWQTRYTTGVHAGLGCARYRGELTRKYPDMMERVGECFDDQHPKRHWCRIDWWLNAKLLPGVGETMHVHTPALDHLRPTDGPVLPSHQCRPPGAVRPQSRLCLDRR